MGPHVFGFGPVGDSGRVTARFAAWREALPLSSFSQSRPSAHGGEGRRSGRQNDKCSGERGIGDEAGDVADDGPAPGVQEEPSKSLAPEERLHLRRQLGVSRGLLRGAAHLGIGLSAGCRHQVGGNELIGVGLGLQTIGWPAVLPSDFTVAIWLGRFCGSRGREVGTIGPFVSLL